MERPYYRLTILLLTAFSSLSLRGNYKTEIYDAYISGNMHNWKVLIDQLENKKKAQSADILELVNYQYGYIAWCIGNDKDEEAEQYLTFAEENVKLLEERKFNLSMVNGYKAAFYGYRIGMNVFLAPYYGRKSFKCAEDAIAINKNNPFGYLQFANIQFYMPPAFGGSKQEAIEYYIKAEKMMELDKLQIIHDWNYLNLLITIANSYIEIKQPENAQVYFEKVLRFEPNCEWVKSNLYPQLMKNLIKK